MKHFKDLPFIISCYILLVVSIVIELPALTAFGIILLLLTFDIQMNMIRRVGVFNIALALSIVIPVSFGIAVANGFSF